MKSKLTFEISWEDAQQVAEQHYGLKINQTQSKRLLSRIKDGLEHWFAVTSLDVVSDSINDMVDVWKTKKNKLQFKEDDE